VRPRCRRTWPVQSYSPGCANVQPMHVLPSAHPRPNPKHQLDRFSRFARSLPVLYNGPPLSSSKLPLAHEEICTPPSNRPTCFLGLTPFITPKRHLDRFSRFFAQLTARSLPYTLQWAAPPIPKKVAPSHGESGTLHLIHGSLAHSSAQSWTGL